ncbi:MAG: accessory gene regulator B family protein [Lachnospiraceae bacterium]|nr:accessory gene regulator B family protein [Lachnospiraceae bacterium]
MERINGYLAKHFIEKLNNYKNYNENQMIKITYAFCVLAGEMEKLLLLIIIFSIVGKGYAFFIIMVALFCSKHYVGGIHMKTVATCFIASLIAIAVIIFMGEKFIFQSEQKMFIYILSILLMYFFAPMYSENRVITNRKKVKIKGICAAFMMGIFGAIVGGVTEQYIVWTLLLINIEIVIGSIMYYRKERRKQ